VTDPSQGDRAVAPERGPSSLTRPARGTSVTPPRVHPFQGVPNGGAPYYR